MPAIDPDRLLAAIDRRFAEIAAPRTVWTVGNVRFEPGEPSIIPGRAEAILQFRDVDAAVAQRYEAALRELVAVPSIGGISHHWSENTSDEDIVLGARVFADAIASVLKG